jgi:hypothetical protein
MVLAGSARRDATGARCDGEMEIQMSSLPIGKFLDLSTAHLRKDIRANLDEVDGLVVDKTSDGWLVYAHTNAAEFARDYDWPDELLPIIELARSNGCTYVLFDRDADAIGCLPSWPR